MLLRAYMKFTKFACSFLIAVGCASSAYAKVEADKVDYILTENGDGTYSSQVKIGEGVNVNSGVNLGHVGGVYVNQGAETVDQKQLHDVSIEMTGGHVDTLSSGNFRAQSVGGAVDISVSGGSVGTIFGGNCLNTALNGAYGAGAKIDSVDISISGNAQVGWVTGGSHIGKDGGAYDAAYIEKYATSGDVTITVEDVATVDTLCGAMYGSETIDGDVTLNIKGGAITNVFGTNAGSVTGDVNIYLTGGSVSTYIYGGDANNIGGNRTLYVGTETQAYNGSTYYVYGFDSIVVAAGSSLTTTGGLDYSQVTEFNFTLSAANLNEASLQTNGTIYMCYDRITVNLDAADSLEDGRYILIDAGNMYAPYWSADYVTLNVEGFDATFDDLKWEDNQLVLYVKSAPVPEPTTATLSLLALAALAARRRRR